MTTRLHKANRAVPQRTHVLPVVEDPGAGADIVDDEDERGAGRAPKTPGQRRRKRWTAVVAVLSLTAVAGFGYLGWSGMDAARNVVGGTTQEVITDPDAPGYVAVVDDTRVSMVALTAEDGTLDSALIFPEPSGGSAALVWILGELLVDDAGTDIALRAVFERGGIEELSSSVATVLGFAVTDSIVASASDIDAVAGYVAPISTTNANPVRVDGDDGIEVRFATGALELEADEAGEFMTAISVGDPPENRAIRAKAILEPIAVGLAELVEASPEEPAERPDDLGGFLIRWGGSDPRFITLPTDPIPFQNSYLYRPDSLAIAQQITPEVPFPTSAFPGQRARVRLLNGTTDTSAASSVALDVAQLGAEISSIGNAAALDVTETTVLYSDEAFAEAAARIAEYFGVSATLTDVESDTTDIDVVLGADQNQ